MIGMPKSPTQIALGCSALLNHKEKYEWGYSHVSDPWIIYFLRNVTNVFLVIIINKFLEIIHFQKNSSVRDYMVHLKRGLFPRSKLSFIERKPCAYPKIWKTNGKNTKSNFFLNLSRICAPFLTRKHDSANSSKIWI